MSCYGYMIKAARDSKYNAKHWFRYLCKVISEDTTYLTQEDMERLLNCSELTMFQKVTLKCANNSQHPLHEYIVRRNKPAKLVMVPRLMEKYKNAR